MTAVLTMHITDGAVLPIAINDSSLTVTQQHGNAAHRASWDLQQVDRQGHHFLPSDLVFGVEEPLSLHVGPP